MLGRKDVSEDLLAVADRIVEWVESDIGKRSPNVFKVEGYAGTGKTTLIAQVIKRMGEATICCAALSGKAAFVMRQKGIENATTIHSLIYKIEDCSSEENEVRAQLEALPERPETSSRIKELKERLRTLSGPRFVLNPQSSLNEADLLILDEVSMVDETLAKDLLSFRKPVLVVGDPGQLPPVMGHSGYFDTLQADVTLDEVYRQEADSGIIQFATDIRLGNKLKGNGTDVLILRRSMVIQKNGEQYLPKLLLDADQVITNTNRTRRELNRMMLEGADHSSTFPSGRGEKLICVKNDRRLGVINGMPVALTNVSDPGPNKRYFDAVLLAADDDGVPTCNRGRVRVYKGYFETAIDGDETRIDRERKVRSDCVEIDWGYAITCHKAQGSEWAHVVVVDEGLGGSISESEPRRRWLYTAATRASEKLVHLRWVD